MLNDYYEGSAMGGYQRKYTGNYKGKGSISNGVHIGFKALNMSINGYFDVNKGKRGNAELSYGGNLSFTPNTKFAGVETQSAKFYNIFPYGDRAISLNYDFDGFASKGGKNQLGLGFSLGTLQSLFGSNEKIQFGLYSSGNPEAFSNNGEGTFFKDFKYNGGTNLGVNLTYSFGLPGYKRNNGFGLEVESRGNLNFLDVEN